MKVRTGWNSWEGSGQDIMLIQQERTKIAPETAKLSLSLSFSHISMFLVY